MHYRLIQHAEQLPEVATTLAPCKEIALDLETYEPGKEGALDPFANSIRLVALKGPDTPVFLLDLLPLKGDWQPVIEAIQHKPLVIHNAAFDLATLKVKHPEARWGPPRCTKTASQLLTAGQIRERNSLGDCLSRYLGIEVEKELGKSDWSVPILVEEQYDYAATDVAHLFDLRAHLLKLLQQENMIDLYKLENMVVEVAVGMQVNGILADPRQLEEAHQQADDRAKELEAVVQEGFGEINLNSPKQLKAAFEAKGYEIPNSQESTLFQHKDKPGVSELLQYKKAAKHASWCKGMVDAIQYDGRIHGTFQPGGSEAGRFSASKPNLQQVPRGAAREAFKAPAGHVLVVADYSQIEMRVAAVVTHDQTMLQAFQDGEDLHRVTASRVSGKALEEVTDEDRSRAKAFNFGIIFGMKPKSLRASAEETYGVPMTLKEATDYYRGFFDTYRGFKAWKFQAELDVLQGKLATRTRTNRKRTLDPEQPAYRLQNQLLNTPIQGGAADVMKIALALLKQRLPMAARMLMVIHDEVVIEVPEFMSDQVKEIVESTMEEAFHRLYPEVPCKVDANVGRSWGEAK